MMKIDFDCQPWIYLSATNCISTLQRIIIVHSIIYYELNSSVITDKEFDEISKELIVRQKNKNLLKMSQYYYCMKDFDGTTGFDLYSRLSEYDRMYLRHIAEKVLEFYRSEGKNAERID